MENIEQCTFTTNGETFLQHIMCNISGLDQSKVLKWYIMFAEYVINVTFWYVSLSHMW